MMASGAEQPAGQRARGVVLAEMHAVRADLEREVGAVVQDEGDPVGRAHLLGQAGPLEQGPRLELLVPELDDVDAAADGGLEEEREIGAVRRCRGRAGGRRCRRSRGRLGGRLHLLLELAHLGQARLAHDVGHRPEGAGLRVRG